MLLQAIGWLIFDAVILGFGIACVFFVVWWIVNCIRGLKLVIGFQERASQERGLSVPNKDEQPSVPKLAPKWDEEST